MKKILPIIITVIIAGGAGFYGGMKYGQSAGSSAANPRNFEVNGQQPGGSGAGRRGGIGQNGGFVGGEIIAKDDKSITVKLQNGSSKIVFLSNSTPVMKSVQGSSSDLSIGEQVTVTGSANSDGSITAQSVQIRPAPKTN